MSGPVRDIHDHYFKKAKRLGYAARSAFKLKEIQDRRKLIRKGHYVLDLGCAPGAWLQIACQNLGPEKNGGLVIGVDLQPTRKQNKFWDDRIHTIEGNAFADETADRIADFMGNKSFDIVLSDMMDATMGHQSTDHHRSVHHARGALEIARCNLKPGGHFIVKVFEGAEFSTFRSECKTHFTKVKGFSPQASRQESREMYVICEAFNPH